MKRLHLVYDEDAPVRLDEYLRTKIDQSHGAIRKIIKVGGVTLNRKKCTDPSAILKLGSRIEVTLKEPEKAAQTFDFDPKWILYQDESLVVVLKPEGLPTQPTQDPKRESLYSLFYEWLKLKNQNAYLGLHHRLDKDTSGILLFTLKKEANLWVSDLFKERKIKKTYYTLVEGHPKEKQFSIQNFLKKTDRIKKIQRYGSTRSGGDLAITHFEVIEQGPAFSLLKALPETGRTHQIRVHLSELGYPVVGDLLYGAKKAQRLFLHAETLEFFHAELKTQKKIESALPNIFLETLKTKSLFK